MSSSTSSAPLPSNSTHRAYQSKKKHLHFSSPEAQSFVTIIVGKAPAQQEFRIHKIVAEYYSLDFFGRAFSSAMIDGQTQSIILEDVDPAIFGLVYNWLYTQNLENEHGQGLKLIEYTKIWSLARRFLFTELEGDALKFVERVGPHVDIEGRPKTGSTLADFQRYAYEDAPEDQRSELQSIAILKTIKHTFPGDAHALMKTMPEDMIPQFVKALLRRHWDDQIALAKDKSRAHGAESQEQD